MDNILLSTFLPLLDYTSDMVNSAFTKVNATDYAIAEFDRSVLDGLPSTITSNTLLGYAPRYIDYRTDVDFSFGGFKII